MDNILTNKYFTVAILIGLALMVYLYIRSDRSIEGFMGIGGINNINYGSVGRELNDVQYAWVDGTSGTSYGRVNKEQKLINKLQKKGYVVTAKADSDNLSSDIPSTTEVINKNQTMRTRVVAKDISRYASFPQPLDTRPDLSQCQPCNCADK